MSETPPPYGPSAPSPTERVVGALRRHWWIALGVSVLLPAATVGVLSLSSPLYESEGMVRIEAEGPGFRGLEALEGLQALTGGGAAGVQTEIEMLSSRSLALAVNAELGIRPRMVRPRGLSRSRIFEELHADPSGPEAEYDFAWDGEAFRVESRIREVPEVWRPFQRRAWRELDPVQVRPGEAFQLEGLSGRLLTDAAERVREIRVEVPSEHDFLERWNDHLSVSRPQRDADVVTVSYQHPDPVIARDAVDLLQRRYIERRRDLRSRESQETAVSLREQVEGVRGELENAEEELRAFREGNRVIAPAVEAEEGIVQLAELQARRDVAAAEGRALQSFVERITANTAAGVEGATEEPAWRRLVGFPTLLENPATAEFLNQLAALENERAALLEVRTEDDLQVQLLTGRIEEVTGQIRDIAESYLDGLNEQVTSLDAVLAGYHGELDRIPQLEMEYARRFRQVELLSEVLTVLEIRHREEDIRAVVQDQTAQIVDPGRLPTQPVSPRPWISLGLSLLLGVSLGTVGALVRDGV